jgi:hypothetical protein
MSSGIYKLPEYTQHPVAVALMPGGMDDTEFDAFCADVEQRGILFPAGIVTVLPSARAASSSSLSTRARTQQGT